MSAFRYIFLKCFRFSVSVWNFVRDMLQVGATGLEEEDEGGGGGSYAGDLDVNGIMILKC